MAGRVGDYEFDLKKELDSQKDTYDQPIGPGLTKIE